MSKYISELSRLLCKANLIGPVISEKEAGDLLEQELRLLADSQYTEQVLRDEDVKRLLSEQIKQGRCTQEEADAYFAGQGRLIGLCWGGAQEPLVRELLAKAGADTAAQEIFLGKITYDVDHAVRAVQLHTAAAVRRFAYALSGHERRHWHQPESIIQAMRARIASGDLAGAHADGSFDAAYFERVEELDADKHGLRAMISYITDIESCEGYED
jgi:hypothetical protein